MPVATIYYSAYGFLSAINLTKVVMVVSLEINLLNIGFNYLLIYGKLGLPQLGIEGAAWGALLAHILGVAHLLIIISSSKKIKKYQCLRFNRIQPRLLLDIAKVTAPVATQELAALSVFLLFESIVSKIGILYLAITHIVFSVCEFNRTIVGGFAKGASILIGNCLGRGERKEAVRFAYASEVIAFCVGTVILFVVLFFPSLVVQIFNSDAETVAAGSAALRFFAVFFFIEIMGFSFEIIFSHNGWGKYVLFSEFSTNMIFMLGVTFYLTAILNKGIYGAWTGFALYIVFHASILFAGFMSQKWLDVQVETE
jgi:Na+-driven multidrug efflux pump